MEEFNRNTIPVTESGCWLWIGSQSTISGYGLWKRFGEQLAHRAAYILLVDLIPKNMLVLHKCDTRLCVNPKHLYIGTHKDNTRDAVNRGRQYCKYRNASHCIHGHEFTESNTYNRKDGKRDCITCRKIRRARYDKRA